MHKCDSHGGGISFPAGLRASDQLRLPVVAAPNGQWRQPSYGSALRGSKHHGHPEGQLDGVAGSQLRNLQVRFSGLSHPLLQCPQHLLGAPRSASLVLLIRINHPRFDRAFCTGFHL